MASKNEQTSEEVAKIAGRCLRNPASANYLDIKALAGCCLTQAADIVELKKQLNKSKPKKKGRILL